MVFACSTKVVEYTHQKIVLILKNIKGGGFTFDRIKNYFGTNKDGYLKSLYTKKSEKDSEYVRQV